jgi:hypothetical protein
MKNAAAVAEGAGVVVSVDAQLLQMQLLRLLPFLLVLLCLPPSFRCWLVLL